jgi:hypothetical protein
MSLRSDRAAINFFARNRLEAQERSEGESKLDVGRRVLGESHTLVDFIQLQDAIN